MVLGLRTYLKLAAGLGFEPRYSPPEGEVLPLDDPALLYVHTLTIPFTPCPLRCGLPMR